jgi:hypothetical protein
MVWFVALIALAGCGRVGFEIATNQLGDSGTADGGDADVVPLGHDEDGDGVPDSEDVCPHVADSQADGDSDGVGDMCDPNPTVPGEQITLFATMGPGDQPLVAGSDDGVWTQLADALEFSGDPAIGGDNNLYGEHFMPLVVGNVRVALGIDVSMVIPGSPSGQNQISIAVTDNQLPLYFVELNQVAGLFDASQITYYDGNYFATDPQDLNGGIRTGFWFFETTQVVNTGVTFVTRYQGETYTSRVMDSLYQGATELAMRCNNVHFQIRWLVVITSP